MLYVYGLVEKRTLPDLFGVCGAPLQALASSNLVAVVSELESVPAPTEPRLWEHESVLEALLVEGPVLPVRFGVAFRTRHELVRLVESRATAFAEALERVRGRAEVAVRVVEHGERPDAPALPTGSRPGTQYMLARLERRREAAARVGLIRDALAPLAVAERARFLPQAATLLAAAYLVDASKLDAFRAEAARVQREVEDVGVVCTGPWPPYNFVGAM